nr:DNA polymerase kappa-like [Lepeophtheirus salmonis]
MKDWKIQNSKQYLKPNLYVVYVHLYLDAFYASVECLYDPSLKDVPLGIRSNLMLATANYHARKYGVHAGMPGYQAKILCPQIKIVKFTKLTASAGISICRGLAKLSTSINKPNGQFALKSNFSEFLGDKPIKKLNGIGNKTTQFLNRSLNINIINDLKDNLEVLFLTLPYKTFLSFFYYSYGLSSFDFRKNVDNVVKSVGSSHSFIPTDN